MLRLKAILKTQKIRLINRKKIQFNGNANIKSEIKNATVILARQPASGYDILQFSMRFRQKQKQKFF